MRPELFVIPFLNLSIKSYGVMMVLGFLAALFLARRRARRLGENHLHVTDFAVWTLVAGIAGARLMHVLHNWPQYRDRPWQVLAIWSGGLEFLGGVVAALLFTVLYLRRKKLPTLKYLDILAPSLMLGLAFGRMGCFLNGCCFGAPSCLPWACRFPALNTLHSPGAGCREQTALQYSFPYAYQLTPDSQRPGQPLLQLPADFYDGYTDGRGRWIASLDYADPQQRQGFYLNPKSPDQLTDRQRADLRAGRYPMHPIHPAQLYSVANALFLGLLLSLIFRRYRFPGQVFCAMLVLYGVARFLLEMVRVEPLEFDGLTISQNLGILAVCLGGAGLILLPRRRRLAQPPS